MTTRTRILGKSAQCVLLVLCCLAITGCYRRVVDVDGPNAPAYDVHEPSNRDNPIDNTIDDLLGTEEYGQDEDR